MKLVDYLGRKMKDTEMIELLESNAMEISYNPEGLHENSHDYYISEANEAGFLLKFNESQILITIICYLTENEDFNNIDRNIIGIPLYDTPKEAMSEKNADANADIAVDLSLVRIQKDKHEILYEYSLGAHRSLRVVTLMLKPHI